MCLTAAPFVFSYLISCYQFITCPCIDFFESKFLNVKIREKTLKIIIHFWPIGPANRNSPQFSLIIQFFRISVRKCSREFRHFIDSSRVEYPMFCLSLYGENVYMGFMTRKESEDYMNETIGYQNENATWIKVRHIKKDYWKYVQARSNLERAVADFATFVKSPMSYMQSFCIGYSDCRSIESGRAAMLAAVETALENTSHQISTREIKFRSSTSQEEVLQVLPHLKPGTLRAIVIDNRTREVEKLAETNQWKMAGRVH